MNETLITDLVDRRALDQLAELDNRMEGTLQQFKNCAMELAKGIKIPVEVSGDLDKLQQLTTVTMQRASQAAQQYTQQLQQQQQVVANTTNTISRQLQAQENLNKAQREAFDQDRQAQQLANALLGTRQQNYQLLARYTSEMKANKDAQKQVNEQEKQGLITQEQAIQRRAALMAEYDKTKTAAQELTKILAAENREANAVEGSYQQLSQKLERLKMAYKQMTDAQKASTGGKQLEAEIQNLDAHLKDLAADMGEHQRNVGNYAIAAQNMKGTLRELTEEIAQLTLQYNELTDEEQRSDVGMQMRDKITELTEQAGKYKDIISDVKQSISGSASDTRLFDTLIETGKVFAATMGVAETACRALGMSEDSLQQSMLKVQQAMQAVQALQVIQNALQKQSNIMKGIAILQSKAAAQAAKMEAAATASATGATKAQTVAQAAFNLVAKANPYVLLATAILAVIGLIVAYTSSTEDATKADEAAKKAIDARKDSVESMAQSFGNSAGEMIGKLKLMRTQWNALGDDMKAKEQYIKQNQADFDKLGEAVYGAGTKVTTFNQVENIVNDNTGQVEKAIMKRAMAMAAYAEYIRLTQLELQELEKIGGDVRWRVFKKGDEITTEEYKRLLAGGMFTSAVSAQKDLKYNQGLQDYEYANTGKYIIEDAAAATTAAMTNARKTAAESMDEITERYDRLRKVVFDKAKENGAFDPANFVSGTAVGDGGKTTTKSSTGKNAPKVKDAEEIQKILDDLLLEGYKSASELEEKYTEEWVAAEKKRIEKARDNEIAAANEKAASIKKDIEASKMSEEDKAAKIIDVDNATNDIIDKIKRKATDEEKALDDEVLKHKQEVANKQVETVANAAAAEQAIRDVAYQEAVTELYKEYNESLRIAQKTGEDTTKITEKFNADKIALEQDYAYMTAKAQIDALQKELEVADLSEEERERIRKELAEQTAQLAQQEAEQEQEAINSTVKADEEARKKRQQNLQEWVQNAGEAVQKIGEFISSMYDGQISKVEEALEAEQQRYDAEVAHIEYLAERGAITTEEAEIRKRDAEEATAKKQEALEKKKAALEYKKAVMEKANSISQIAIATALGIMKASPNIPLMAFVGAMGAIQVATALAQPIKAYAEGTKGKKHPGGLALVGDGDKAEVVMYDGKAWVTPDTPTLVDLPKGAEVLPDADKVPLLSAVSSIPRDRATGQPIVINDYSALESRVATNTKAVTKALREHQHALTRQLKRQKFNAYIASRI